jgi:hypothetical protein
LPPIRACLWGGPWTTAIATNSSITISYGSPGANGTNRSARASGVIGVSPTPGWSDFSVQLYSGWPVPSFNASGNGLAGLQFWFYGDGATYRVCMTSTAVTDYNFYGISFTPPAGTWSFYQVPFSSMTRQAGWGSQTGLPRTPQEFSSRRKAPREPLITAWINSSSSTLPQEALCRRLRKPGQGPRP